MRYLTKSRFKLALECLTKLYYTGKKTEYSDQKVDDPFLRELARGGFQVGELAKFLFCENPVEEKITIETLDYDDALKETQRRLDANERVIIAEAAFRYNTLFVRTDILVKDGSRVEIYEVKAKSIDKDEQFLPQKGLSRIAAKWEPKLYDVAFQKYVVSKAFQETNTEISANLILVDKNAFTSIDGLNQKFKIYNSSNGKQTIEVEKGLRRSALGNQILRIINVDREVELIWNHFPVPTEGIDAMKFEDFVIYCADVYGKDQRIFTSVGSRCKKCEFVNLNPNGNGLKDGRMQCWKHATSYDESVLRKDLVIDLWMGGTGSRHMIDELVSKKKYLLENVGEVDIIPKLQKSSLGLTYHQRRMEQVSRAASGTTEPYFDKNGVLYEMESWKYPLHMIDFETTITALPFHKRRRPYEGIAFQFSHHVIQEDGRIAHVGQYLSFTPGVFPNYEFVRELKKQLEVDDGWIFRYHNHENTFLRIIYQQLSEDPDPPSDQAELQAFIETITTSDGKTGSRAMIDLFKLVLAYYYSPITQGRNSIKHVLPAIIHDSAFLQKKYSKPVYGKNKEVKSLNFDSHVWISKEVGNDPYKTLPRLFDEYETEELDRMVQEFDELADGGGAMTAYNMLQFSEIPEDQRKRLEAGLLRYCELDTMAMVMIVEGWKDLASC